MEASSDESSEIDIGSAILNRQSSLWSRPMGLQGCMSVNG